MSTPSAVPQSPHAQEGRTLRQLTIVVTLVLVLIVLHRWAGGVERNNLDPTALLALGFVVLGSYTIGALAEVVRLPHITGYLLAGLFFGPSLAHAIAPQVSLWLGLEAPWPPFDEGILNPSVVEQLSLFDTLAIALIAISAGGELKVASLRDGMRAMLGIIAGQYTLVMLTTVGFVVLISGFIPAIALPGLALDSPLAAVGLGVIVGAIAFAASPAATLAIISETGASGSMSRTVLSTIVFEDVLVIVTFVLGKFLAATFLGVPVEPLGIYLAQHVGGGVGLGLLLGLIVVLYLRFFGRELMIFLVGVVYTATLVADVVHADKLLMFLTLGFIVGNFSKAGERLIEKVEQLALPTYVVFFTIAGARMHLDLLRDTLAFALSLCALRFVSIYVGVRAGARWGGASPTTVQYGWLGFLAQAGVALALANQLMALHGGRGVALGTMVMGAIAVNELFGPVFFKVAITLAGEGRTAARPVDTGQRRLSVPPPAQPSSRPAAARAPDGRPALAPWSEPSKGNPWGKPLRSASARLDERVHELERDLHLVVREVSEGPLRAFRADAEAYLRALRREFLRHHRRYAVQTRDTSHAGSSAGDLDARLIAELAEAIRGIVLGRAAQLKQGYFRPEDTVDAIDAAVAGLPLAVTVPVEPGTYGPRVDDGLVDSVRRVALLAGRALRRLMGFAEPQRELPLRELARYHLALPAPERLQRLAELFAEAERHLVNRTRSLYTETVHAYATGSHEGDADDDDAARHRRLRAHIETELASALEETRRIAQDGTVRTAQGLGEGFKLLKGEALDVGTFRLPARKRRAGRKLLRRERALAALTTDVEACLSACEAGYGALAMELELAALEARVEAVLREQTERLEGELERRAHQQAERVQLALAGATERLRGAVATTAGESLAARVRDESGEVTRTAADAARVVLQLQDELDSELKLVPLLEAVRAAVSSLSRRYDVLVGEALSGAWNDPTQIEPVEVPFRDLVLSRVDGRVAPELRSTAHEWARKVRPLQQVLQDLDRKVAFHVELALGEIEAAADEPADDAIQELLSELLLEPLGRHQEAIDALLEESRMWPSALGARVRSAVRVELASVRAALVGSSATPEGLRAFQREADKLGRRAIADFLPGAVASVQAQMGHVARTLAGDERVDRWRQWAGVPAARRARRLDAGAFAPVQPVIDVPAAYRRLFSAEVMNAGDVVAGRERAVLRATEVLAQRTRGRLRSVALVGLEGVGKSAIAGEIVRAGRFRHVRTLSLSGPCDVSVIEEAARSGPEGQLLVVDGVHWLASAAPGGFAEIRHFAEAVISDRGHHAWLIHVDELVFAYLSSVAPLAQAFPERIHIAPMSAPELRDAVLARAHHAGLENAFGRGDGFRNPKERYFRELHAESGGLLRDALRLWVGSITRFVEDERVHLGRVPPGPRDGLSGLPEPVLLTLYQVARMGWIHPPALAQLFRVDLGAAHAELVRLTHLGLLQDHGERVYRVAPHLRGALVLLLRERGWT